MEDQEYTGEQEHVEAAAQPANDHDTAQAVAQEEERVPLSALQAERRQRQELQNNMKMLQDHLELMKANAGQNKPQEDQLSSFQDDDVLTVGEAKKYLDNLQRNYNMSIEELKMQQAYPDYAETVRKYLPDVLNENPELRDDIQRAKNPYKLAYFLSKKSDQYKADTKQVKKNDSAERILKNSNRAGNLSAVGQSSSQNTSKTWSQMSDQEFLKHVNRHMGYS